MKILIVSDSDGLGGANLAAYRLHKSIINNGIDSQMLVQNKIGDDYKVIGPKSNLRRHLINPIRPAFDQILMKINKAENMFSTSYLPFSEIVRQINEINPDIVHLHWIAGGMLRIEDLKKISIPIVWSLHDMWAFTGGCHYDRNCGLYKKNCGNCKTLGRKKENDLSRSVFNRKLKSYSQLDNLTIVALSRWIGKCAKRSSLLKNRKIINLPNPINTELFTPIDKSIARNILGLPSGKRIILFSAIGSLSDPRKGAQELFKALKVLDVSKTVFMIAGSSKPKNPPKLKYPTYFIPPARDEISMSLIYNAADLLVVPSLQENLANSIVESMACGVPAIAFNIGGNGDIIDHMQNGYLAKAIVPKDLARGIQWALKDKNLTKLSKNSRIKAMDFDSNLIADKYIKLYKEIQKKI